MQFGIRRSIGARALAATFAVFMAGSVADGPVHAKTYTEMPEDGWTTYKSDDFGYALYYPSAYFQPDAIAAGGEPKTFVSPDKKAKLVVSGVDNDDGFTLASYRSTLLGDFGGYDALDYSPKGQSWFVLSGYRGETIYYQKVMFSCGNRMINIFSVTFPIGEKAVYERLIEVMEDKFRPGRGADAPAGCRH